MIDAIEPALFLERYPRSVIDVFVEIIQADGTELQLPSIKIDTVSGTITVTTTSTDTATSAGAGGPGQQGLRSLNVELRMPIGRDGRMVLPPVRM